jgi:hypothetical protein
METLFASLRFRLSFHLKKDTFTMAKAYFIIFILTLSALFPLAGYYLDYRVSKKRHQKRESGE